MNAVELNGEILNRLLRILAWITEDWIFQDTSWTCNVVPIMERNWTLSACTTPWRFRATMDGQTAFASRYTLAILVNPYKSRYFIYLLCKNTKIRMVR